MENISAQIAYQFMRDPLLSLAVAFTIGSAFAALVIGALLLPGVSSAKEE